MAAVPPLSPRRPSGPAMEPRRTAGRIIDLLFPTAGPHAHAWGAWTTSVGQLWCSPALIGTSQRSAPLLSLLDPDSPTGLVALARSARAVGKLVAICAADGSLLAAVAADEAALEAWQHASLAVEPRTPRPDVEMVRWLVAEHRIAIAGRRPAGEVTGVASEGRSTVRSHPSVERLLLDHLAGRLRGIAPELVPPSGGLASRLARVDGTPPDLRLHLPPSTTSVIALPPDPATDEAGLRRWCNAPVALGRYAPSRLLASLPANREDLAEAYPDLTSPRWQIELWRWAEHFGTERADEDHLPVWAIRPPVPLPVGDPQPSVITSLSRAVRVVGYLEASLGLGEAARVAVAALERAGEAVETVADRHVVSSPVSFRYRHRPGQPTADVDLICLAGRALSRWARAQPTTIGLRAYRIGLWFWETGQLPVDMAQTIALLDEIWVTSTYTADTVRAAAPPGFPVHVVPLGTMPLGTMPPDRSAGAATGSGSARRRVAEAVAALQPFIDRRWCGFSFDLSSGLTRKNPLGLLNAWRDAFPEPDNSPGSPVLVLKTSNGHIRRDNLHVLQEAADRPDVIVIDDYWSADLHAAFIRSLSAYVSLHRSEGYGLVLLDALACGVPVIATKASGNLEFMDDESSWLVPADPYVLSAAEGPYARGDTMFEPRTADAASYLREVMDSNPASVAERAHRVSVAQQRVAPLVNGTAAARWMAARLAAIRAR